MIKITALCACIVALFVYVFVKTNRHFVYYTTKHDGIKRKLNLIILSKY